MKRLDLDMIDELKQSTNEKKEKHLITISKQQYNILPTINNSCKTSDIEACSMQPSSHTITALQLTNVKHSRPIKNIYLFIS